MRGPPMVSRDVSNGETMRTTAYLTLSALLCGCVATHRSNVADTMGYSTGSRMVDVGAYQVHAGADGTNDFLLVADGNRNLYSTESRDVTVYAGGQSFFDYSDEDGDGVVDKYMVHIRDKAGNDTITLVDADADGTLDHKIDHKAKVFYDWKADRWVERSKQ